MMIEFKEMIGISCILLAVIFSFHLDKILGLNGNKGGRNEIK